MFSLLIVFLFPGLEQQYLFSYTVCVFLDFFTGFIHLLFKELYHPHKGSFMVCFCASDILQYSRPCGRVSGL